MPGGVFAIGGVSWFVSLSVRLVALVPCLCVSMVVLVCGVVLALLVVPWGLSPSPPGSASCLVIVVRPVALAGAPCLPA